MHVHIMQCILSIAYTMKRGHVSGELRIGFNKMFNFKLFIIIKNLNKILF